MKKILILIYLLLVIFGLNAQEHDEEYYDNGYDLLFFADSGDINHVIRLVDTAKADVNFVNEDGVSALMFAAQAGHDTIVKLFIDRNVNINHKSSDLEISALLAAVKNDYLETAQILIRAGANINDVDIFKRSSLHYAVIYGFEATADMLLYYDANIELKDTYGNTVLFYAVKYDDDVIVQMLMNDTASNLVAQSDSSSLIHVAAYNGNLYFIEKYSHLFDLDRVNEEGLMAIDLAIAGGHADVLIFFLESNCTLRDTINQIYSPRTFAKSSGNKETRKIIRKLKIKDIHYPYFGKVKFASDFIFNGDDFFMAHNVGICDLRYGISAEIGMMYRPYERKILFPAATDTFYQLRESRQAFLINISKDVRLFNTGFSSYFSLFGEMQATYYYGKYDGMQMSVSEDFIASPGIGLAFTFDEIFRMSFACKYLDLPICDTNPVFYSIGFRGLLNFRNYIINEKYKYIINY